MKRKPAPMEVAQSRARSYLRGMRRRGIESARQQRKRIKALRRQAKERQASFNVYT